MSPRSRSPRPRLPTPFPGSPHACWASPVPLGGRPLFCVLCWAGTVTFQGPRMQVKDQCIFLSSPAGPSTAVQKSFTQNIQLTTSERVLKACACTSVCVHICVCAHLYPQLRHLSGPLRTHWTLGEGPPGPTPAFQALLRSPPPSLPSLSASTTRNAGLGPCSQPLAGELRC